MTSTPNFDSIMDITPRPPIVFVAGSGSWLTDSEGRTYLDFIQGWAVNCLGHSPRPIIEALARQAERLINCSPAFYNDQMIRLSDLLTRHSGLHQVFLANSGAEANEGAIKLARKWGAKHRDGAYEIITMDHGFHGRTLATMAASGKAQWEHLYEPKVSGFVKVPLNDLAAVAAAITPRTVAVMLEPIQGEAGVFEASIPFLRGLRALTRERGILLILDEIQTGIGRTGRLFGCRTRRRHARHHDPGQGARRRRAAGRPGRASRRVLLRVRRSGRYVLRQSDHGGGRLRGDRGGHAAGLSRARDAGRRASGAPAARAVGPAWLWRGARDGPVAGARSEARHRAGRSPRGQWSAGCWSTRRAPIHCVSCRRSPSAMRRSIR